MFLLHFAASILHNWYLILVNSYIFLRRHHHNDEKYAFNINQAMKNIMICIFLREKVQTNWPKCMHIHRQNHIPRSTWSGCLKEPTVRYLNIKKYDSIDIIHVYVDWPRLAGGGGGWIRELCNSLTYSMERNMKSASGICNSKNVHFIWRKRKKSQIQTNRNNKKNIKKSSEWKWISFGEWMEGKWIINYHQFGIDGLWLFIFVQCAFQSQLFSLLITWPFWIEQRIYSSISTILSFLKRHHYRYSCVG